MFLFHIWLIVGFGSIFLWTIAILIANKSSSKKKILIVITYMTIIALHFIVRLLLNFRNEKPKTEKYFNNIWGHWNENIENHQIQEH
jgi:predicted histidine transporter YuiF (NhaC family)